MPTLPPLPKIEGDVDLLLDVYTHRSLRYESAPMNDDYGDTERLEELGDKLLDLAVTYHYFCKVPMMSASEIRTKRDQALSQENLASWLDAYGLKSKLRFAPGEQDKVGTPEEIRRFFNTYVGALHIRNGGSIIQEWISKLIDPEADVPPWPASIPDTRVSSGQSAWSTPPPPSQPLNSPPPLPIDNAPMISMGAPSLVSLALVNQTASQRGFVVTYPAEQTGPGHMPTWNVKCLMNGVEQGRGTGKSQKQAKEEAARQAWVRMQW